MEQHQFGLREWAGLCERKDATIAALQAQLESANKLIHKKNCALGRAETIINDLQSQLTQRTAELEAAKDAAMYAGERLGAVLVERDTLQAELERVRERVGQRGLEVVMIGKVGHYVSTAVKEELERVRSLIKALPKVEGEVTVRDITALCWANDGTYGSINCKEQLVSLLQERQKLC